MMKKLQQSFFTCFTFTASTTSCSPVTSHYFTEGNISGLGDLILDDFFLTEVLTASFEVSDAFRLPTGGKRLLVDKMFCSK